MTVNWADLTRVAGDGGFTVMPPGEYDCYVQSASGGKASTGKDRIRVTFKVENGPHAGKVIVNDFVITPDNANAVSIFFRHMAVLGLDAAYFAANPNAPIETVAAALQAKRTRCRLRTSTREWQGQTRTNVDQLLPAMPVTVTAAPPAPAASASSPQPPQVPQHPVSVPANSIPQAVTAPVPEIPAAPQLPDDLPF
jgi:hypothetical protein